MAAQKMDAQSGDEYPNKQPNEKGKPNPDEQIDVPKDDSSMRGVEIVGDLICGLSSGVCFATGHTVLGICFFCLSLCLAVILLAQWISQRPRKVKHIWRYCGIFNCVLIFFLAIWAVLTYQSEELEKLGGILVPANDPMPDTLGMPQDPTGQQKILFLGNCISRQTRFPHIVLEFKGKEVLVISTNKDGITVSCELFGENRAIVAELVNNAFTINPNNYFKRERPDRSTLVIRDQQNIEVIRVRILNQNAIKLTGIIRIFNGPTVTIAEDHLEYGVMRISHSELGGAIHADIVIQ